MSIPNNFATLQDDSKRKRGRPKGSKNRPKQSEQELLLEEQRQRNQMKLKASRKHSRKSSEYYFIMKPKSGAKCHYSTEITVDYTPYKENDCDRPCSIVPKMNVDNKPHIPGFIMDMDKPYYKKNEQRYRIDHESKIDDYTKPKRELYQPKPGKKHNYCCVCKHSYEDYLEHKKLFNSNDFANLIRGISKDYKDVCRTNMKNDLPTEVNTETQYDNDDDCQILPQDSSTLQQQAAQKCITIDDKPLRMSHQVSLSSFKQTNILPIQQVQQQQPQLSQLLQSSLLPLSRGNSFGKLDNNNNNQSSNNNNNSNNHLQQSISNNLRGSSSSQNGIQLAAQNYLALNGLHNCLSLSTKTPSSNTNFQSPSPFNQHHTQATSPYIPSSAQQQQQQQQKQQQQLQPQTAQQSAQQSFQYYPYGSTTTASNNNLMNGTTILESELKKTSSIQSQNNQSHSKYNGLHSSQQQQQHSLALSSNGNGVIVGGTGSKMLMLATTTPSTSSGINGKRKGDLAGIYGENLELTRKNPSAGYPADQIIDLTDDACVLEPIQSTANRFSRQMSVQYVD